MLLTDRSLNDYQLPIDWLPVAAINPVEDGYDAAELDPALLTRFVQINVVTDRDEWLSWAASHHLHPKVISYVQSDPGVFDSPFSNPRSWAYVSDVLHADQNIESSAAVLRATVAGLVGVDARPLFFAFSRVVFDLCRLVTFFPRTDQSKRPSWPAQQRR